MIINEKEVPRTMKGMSVKEMETLKKLNFMVPMDIVGRHQILTKLKDLVVDIDEIIVKPVNVIPPFIFDVCNYFSTDGYWYGNFIAYGTDVYGKEVLLWDDITVDSMTHYNDVVDTRYIKERLDGAKQATLIVATKVNDVYKLAMYCYLP